MTETPDQPTPPEEPKHEHEHHLREELSEELHKIEDEAYVDSYAWGPTILGILLAVVLIGFAIVGWIWLV